MNNYDIQDDFKLADSDDFFGYETPNEIPVSTWEKIAYTIIGIFFAYYIYESVTYILSKATFY